MLSACYRTGCHRSLNCEKIWLNCRPRKGIHVKPTTITRASWSSPLLQEQELDSIELQVRQTRRSTRIPPWIQRAIESLPDPSHAPESAPPWWETEFWRRSQSKNEEPPAPEDIGVADLVSDDSRLSDINIGLAKLKDLLQDPQSQDLLSYVSQICENEDLMRSIPVATFNEILRQLQIRDDYLPLCDAYKALGRKHHRELAPLRLQTYQNIKHRRDKFRKLMSKRVDSGRMVSLSEYNHMLNFARATFDGLLAEAIFRKMISQGIEPDLLTYNYYLEARCWSDAFKPEERHSLRRVPINIALRSHREQKPTYEKEPIQGHALHEGGIRAEVKHLFARMVESGIRPDVKAYTHFLTASAREGDMSAVMRVLNHVWQVDVATLKRGGKADNEYALSLSRASPIYPDEDLLFAVAHAFGTNNDIPTALSVVHHISEAFNVPITLKIWGELLEWTYVMTRKRNMRQVERGVSLDGSLGQLPPKTLESLWDVIVASSPDKPTMLMIDHMVGHYGDHCQGLKILEHLRESVDRHNDLFGYSNTFKSLHLKGPPRRDGGRRFTSEDPVSLSLHEGRKRYFSELTSFALIRRWIDTLLARGPWKWSGNDNRRIYFHQRQSLPKIIEEFWRFKGFGSLQCRIETGWISLNDCDSLAPETEAEGCPARVR